MATTFIPLSSVATLFATAAFAQQTPFVSMTRPEEVLATHYTSYGHGSTFVELEGGRVLHAAHTTFTTSDDGPSHRREVGAYAIQQGHDSRAARAARLGEPALRLKHGLLHKPAGGRGGSWMPVVPSMLSLLHCSQRSGTYVRWDRF